MMKTRLAILLAALLAATACGYSLAGRGSFLPAYVKTIGVPMFGNRTNVFNIETMVTQSTKYGLAQSETTKFRVIEADLELLKSISPKKDEILVQIGEKKWRTKSSLFGPLTFEYGGVNYAIYEKLTGKFAILDGGKAVATGELGFRSCIVREAGGDLELFLANLALGYLIRNLVWEMFR